MKNPKLYDECRTCINYDVGDNHLGRKIIDGIRLLNQIDLSIARKQGSPYIEKETKKMKECDKCFGQRIEEFDENFLNSLEIKNPYTPKQKE